MTWAEFKAWAGTGMSKPLFSMAGSEVTPNSILAFLAIILVSFGLSWLVQRAMRRVLAKSFAGNEGTLASIRRLVHYLVMFFGLGIALNTIGINMNALFAAGAVFAIAIGFAMQNIVQNFVSGIILLVERSIKPGDVLEVEGQLVKIVAMGIRTTTARTLLEEDLIIPNSTLSQSTVKNYTLRDRDFRLGVRVGVTYGSDMRHVTQTLEKTARELPWRSQKTEPHVMMVEFGSSSVDFDVWVHITDPWRSRWLRAELREAIWFAFLDEKIMIAFPQVDVHFDPSVTEALTRLPQAI
ncbi:MAG: mechanosensitive ion channel [Candidatus Lernaella stagnicola]|nr:mechanosensitive ion channel [Candidatus Lernaella stagnicola]